MTCAQIFALIKSFQDLKTHTLQAAVVYELDNSIHWINHYSQHIITSNITCINQWIVSSILATTGMHYNQVLFLKIILASEYNLL